MTTTVFTDSAPVASSRASGPGTTPARFYGGLWRNVPRELGYLVPSALIGFVVLSVSTWAFTFAVGLVLLFVGVLLLALVLLGTYQLGRFELKRMSFTRLAPIPEQRLERPFAGKPVFSALFRVLAVPRYWLGYVHQGLVFPVLSFITATIWFAWVSTALTFALMPLWAVARPFREAGTSGSVDIRGWSLGDLVAYVLQGADGTTPRVDGTTAVVVGFTALGLLMLALYPLVSRGLTWAHWGVDRLLLGTFESDRLRAELARSEDSRMAAVTAEDRALRRLERDIHDGPQQRLVRLQLDLASAARRLDDDPAAARALLDDSLALARETADELRALTNGFAPPLLQDRGLAAALAALAARAPVGVETDVRLERELPGELERSAYFVVAELLSNASKHASALLVRLRARIDPGDPDALVLVVEDDGVGGAALVPGRGLAGMQERVQGLGGTMQVVSPAGGPTAVSVRIPIPAAG